MHQVLVKDIAIWEEPQSLLVYVYLSSKISHLDEKLTSRRYRMNRALLGDGLLATIGAFDHFIFVCFSA